MTPDEAASMARHPSRLPDPPADFIDAGKIGPPLGERDARHLAERLNMDIEDARRALGLVGLTAEEIRGAQCIGCRRPLDQPHAITCPQVMHVPAEGDVNPCGYPERPDGMACGRPMPCLMHESLEDALRHAPARAAVARGWPLPEGVDPGDSPETELCGAQDGDTLRFCTKRFGHTEPPTNDDVHYDHRAKHTWVVANVKRGLL